MADGLTKEKRSWNMKQIKSKNTSIEVQVRKYLFNKGFRYRKNVKDLPGSPDIYIQKYNTVIFINGCFFHHHYKCRLAYIPKTNTDFWIKKFESNIRNDNNNERLLRSMGFKVIKIWECEIRECFEYRMQNLIEEIVEERE